MPNQAPGACFMATILLNRRSMTSTWYYGTVRREGPELTRSVRYSSAIGTVGAGGPSIYGGSIGLHKLLAHKCERALWEYPTKSHWEHQESPSTDKHDHLENRLTKIMHASGRAHPWFSFDGNWCAASTHCAQHWQRSRLTAQYSGADERTGSVEG